MPAAITMHAAIIIRITLSPYAELQIIRILRPHRTTASYDRRAPASKLERTGGCPIRLRPHGQDSLHFVKALSKVWGGWKTCVSRRKHTRAWRSMAGTFPLGAAPRASLSACSRRFAACCAAERCAILHAASDARGKAAGVLPSRKFRAYRQLPEWCAAKCRAAGRLAEDREQAA